MENKSKRVTHQSAPRLVACLLLVVLLGAERAVAQVESNNCLQTNELQYLYPMIDYSGNFTSVKEYWLRKDSDCFFSQDIKSKLTWYSYDIKVKYQRFTQDGNGCRGETFPDGDEHFRTYIEDTIMEVGEKANNTCLIKYHLFNENKLHDLRLQIWNMELSAFHLASGFKVAAVSSAALIVSSLF